MDINKYGEQLGGIPLLDMAMAPTGVLYPTCRAWANNSCFAPSMVNAET